MPFHAIPSTTRDTARKQLYALSGKTGALSSCGETGRLMLRKHTSRNLNWEMERLGMCEPRRFHWQFSCCLEGSTFNGGNPIAFWLHF